MVNDIYIREFFKALTTKINSTNDNELWELWRQLQELKYFCYKHKNEITALYCTSIGEDVFKLHVNVLCNNYRLFLILKNTGISITVNLRKDRQSNTLDIIGTKEFTLYSHYTKLPNKYDQPSVYLKHYITIIEHSFKKREKLCSLLNQ